MNQCILPEDVIETVKFFLSHNKGDEASENLILSFGAELLDVSSDTIIEMIEESKTALAGAEIKEPEIQTTESQTSLQKEAASPGKKPWETQDKLPIRVSRYLLDKAYENDLITFEGVRDGIKAHIGEHWFYCISEPFTKIKDFTAEKFLREAYVAINNEPINAKSYDEATECLYYMHYLQEQLSAKGIDYTRGNLLANIECPHCGHKYYGSGYSYENEWHGKCAKCGKEFVLYVPIAPYVIVFMDDYDDSSFLENFSIYGDEAEYEAVSYYALQTPEEFVKKHLELSECPDSMWYGVFEDKRLVCSGACDPYDAEIFVSNMESADEIRKAYEAHNNGYDFDLTEE